MKRLSDFKDDEGVKIIARLLVPIGKIAQNKAFFKKADATVLEFASALLENNSKEVLEMLAILNEQDVKEYHTDGAEILVNTMVMLSDDTLMGLFGLLKPTTASSASALSNTDNVEA